MSVELLRKCGLLLEAELSLAEEVGTKVMPTNSIRRSLLERGTHLGRKRLDIVEPPPDVSLRNLPTRDVGEFPSERSLATDDGDSTLNSFPIDRHAPEFDNFLCLLQQFKLSSDDKKNGRPYALSMERHDWKTLAARLAWAMGQRRWNDKDVARELSIRVSKTIPWQTIQSIRLGVSKSTVYIAQLAQVLECDAIWLGTGDGEPYTTGVATGPTGELTSAGIAFAKRWQALSPHLRSKVYDVLVAYEALAESEPPPPAAPTTTTPTRGKRRPVTS